MKQVLAVMARTPRAGQTKTRLQPSLGVEGAMAAHVELVQDTLARLERLPKVTTSLWVTEIDAVAQKWARSTQWPLRQQPDGDLGVRMHTILSQLLDEGASSVCLIGTDCPLIDAAYVDAAFSAISEVDVVIGPAEDGGYGLIGLKSPAPELFSQMPWGESGVAALTLERAVQARLSVAQLPTIWDVDTPADWARYVNWKRR